MTFIRTTIARKVLVSAAISVAISFGQMASAANSQVELVPDDSLFYIGTGKPVPVDQFFAMVPDVFNQNVLGDILTDSADSKSEAEFLKQLGEFFQDPAKVTKQWGLGDELQFSVYTVGLMPVFRIAADAKQFEAAMAKLSAEKELKFERLDHKGVDVRISAPEDKDNKSTEAEAPNPTQITTAEEALAVVVAKAAVAKEKLDAANSNFEIAVKAKDASGIASSANEIADAANEISAIQKSQNEATNKLEKLQLAVKGAETLEQTGGKSGPGLIMAADGKDIVIAVSTNAYDPEVLDQLLGLKKPQKSLEASGKLKKIRKEWNYGEELVMYVDNQLIADAFTGGDSLAAKQLDQLVVSDELDIDDMLSEFSIEPCRSEVRHMAANWPMIVSGNRKFEMTDSTVNVDTHFAMVLEHEALRDTLKLLRGVVPVSQSSGEALMSFGVGLDVDNLPQLSGQVTDLISTIGYECEAFDALNDLAKTDISTLSMGAMMASGMARGIKGFSLNLYDADFQEESDDLPVNNVDAAIAISAEDPATLLQTLRMIPQAGMLADLPLDGTAMSLNNMLPIPLPDGIELFAAVKGKNIVLYTGEQAAEFANRVGGNGKEGFIISSFNMAQFLDKIEAATDSLPALYDDKDLAGALNMMKSYPAGSIYYDIDFTDKGIEFQSISEFERNKK